MKIILLDLDNCISNDLWRVPMIKHDAKDPYHLYHMRAIYDEMGNAFLLRTSHKIVIVTGRPNRYRDLTMKWLTKQGIGPQAVLMREDGDHRPAAQSKTDLVMNYILQTNHAIMHAFDDRQDVIQAYWNMGLKATRIWIHNQEVPVGH